MASSSLSRSKRIVLQDSEGFTLEVDKEVAKKSVTIKHMTEDSLASRGPILLSKVPGNILAKVTEYYKRVVTQPLAGVHFAPSTVNQHAIPIPSRYVDERAMTIQVLGYSEVKAEEAQALWEEIEVVKSIENLSINHRHRMGHMEEPLKSISLTKQSYSHSFFFIKHYKVVLRSINGKTLKVDQVKQNQSCSLPNVHGDILAKIVEYYNNVAFVLELVNDDEQTLVGLLVAVDYLNIKGLFSLACENILDMIKRKDQAHICKLFNIMPKFSLEEKERMRSANPWTFN
ncbi:hypothetical protein M9H77_20950 [Catharanthus roseus]|uniref:Uncharacterized protein n=1 Tax=Catharanthus roseus TaxID=4058 RepID=A0ACC0AMF3_CATRO|nr:hypothetical protein M9H77_20950 [Catharanthus roseus]